MKNRPQPEGVLLMHMDDQLCLDKEPTANLGKLAKRFPMGTIKMLSDKETTPYIGLDILWDEKNGRCEIGQDRYAEEIQTGLSERLKKRQFGPDDLKLTKPDEINVDLQKEQMEWAGVLGWLAKTQPQISVIFSEVSRNNVRPSEGSVIAAKRGCEYAKKTHKRLIYEAVADPVLVVWVDASYNIATCDGRVGYEIQLVDIGDLSDGVTSIKYSNLIAWKSKRCDSKLCSTTSAELIALLEGVKIVPMYIRLIESLWRKCPRVIFVSDSQTMMAWLNTGWVTSDPMMQGKLELVKSRLDDMKADVIWVSTKDQRADRQTKYIRDR